MIFDFIGRFHPLLVHLPIGILALAAILEYLFPKRTSPAQMQLILLMAITAYLVAMLSSRSLL